MHEMKYELEGDDSNTNISQLLNRLVVHSATVLYCLTTTYMHAASIDVLFRAARQHDGFCGHLGMRLVEHWIIKSIFVPHFARPQRKTATRGENMRL